MILVHNYDGAILQKIFSRKLLTFFFQEGPTIQVSGVWIPETGRYDHNILV